MNNIFERIEKEKSTFTKSDEKIYQCLQKDIWIITREVTTIIEFADKCGVSKSAVLRFAKKLGYSGFSEFKYAFTLFEHSHLPSTVKENKISYILNSYVSSIEQIKSLLVEDILKKLSLEIINASHIRICGYNRSGFTAMQMKYRLLNLRIESECITDTLVLNTLADISKDNEMFIFFSARGLSQTPTNHYIEKCFVNNKNTVLITTNPNTPYKKFSKTFILLPNIKTNGVIIDEQAIFHIFIEILNSYISDALQH